MTYINGKVDDTSDDILHDKELYNLLCKLIASIEEKGIYTQDEIKKEINQSISVEYQGEERKRLNRVLLIMVMGYRSSYLVRQINQEFSQLTIDNSLEGNLSEERLSLKLPSKDF